MTDVHAITSGFLAFAIGDLSRRDLLEGKGDITELLLDVRVMRTVSIMANDLFLEQ